MKKIKVCIVGMGPIGNLHASIYKENKNVELIGISEIKKNLLETSVKKHNVHGYENYQIMIDNLKPDLCSITTGGFEYGSDHSIPTIYALNSGSNVLCEKPISNSIEEGLKMILTAKRNNLILAINFNHRFTTAAEIAKKWQKNGEIGHPLLINMKLFIKNPNESSPFFHIKALHPHSIDIMRHFFGEIEKVHCFAMKGPGRKIWSNAQINILFSNKAIGSLTGSYDIERGHPMERCEVTGDNGRFVIDDMYREVTLYPSKTFIKKVYTNPIFGGMESFNDTFKNRINNLVDEIIQKVKPENINGSGLDGLKAQVVLESIVRSIKTGNAIETSEVLDFKKLNF